ncbi:hypothetical protein TNCV_3418831 [Trichonephila clavipes]|nr:hypothetical protein TNCV_3418831 [Trichonephila clavipes]
MNGVSGMASGTPENRWHINYDEHGRHNIQTKKLQHTTQSIRLHDNRETSEEREAGLMLGVTGKRNAKRSSIPYLDSVCGLVIEPSALMQSLFLGRLERNDLQKFIWPAENSLRAVEHMDTVSSECLEND